MSEPSFEIRVKNLGPIEGEHELGKVEGPGLYLFVADKGSGKSTLLRTMASMADANLLRSSANIHDGEVDAYLELSPSRVTFSKTSVGTTVTGYSGVPPEVKELPMAFSSLVDADGLKDPAARHRRRLSALMGYVNVPTDKQMLDELLECCCEDFDLFTQDLRQEWDRLSKNIRSGRRVEPLRNRREIHEWLLAQFKGIPDILDAQKNLAGLLNATGLCGEKIAEEKLLEIEGLKGVRAMLQEEQELLEKTLGARVEEWDGEPVAEAVERKKELERGITELEVELRLKKKQREDLSKLLEDSAIKPNFKPLREELSSALQAVADLSAGGELAGAGVELDEGVPRIHFRWQALRKELEHQREVELASKAMNDSLSPAVFEDLESKLASLREQLERFLLSEKLVKQKEKIEEVESKLEKELWVQAKIALTAKQYRISANESWFSLGWALNNKMSLPWLMIGPEEVWIGYRDGKLNSDPSEIEKLRRKAFVEGASGSKRSPVALKRFVFEKLVSAKEIEWRSMEDAARISTCELHEACVEVLLQSKKVQGCVVFPWEVLAAYDQDSLLELAEKCRSHGLVAFGERPRRKGDRPGLFLENVLKG